MAEGVFIFVHTFLNLNIFKFFRLFHVLNVKHLFLGTFGNMVYLYSNLGQLGSCETIIWCSCQFQMVTIQPTDGKYPTYTTKRVHPTYWIWSSDLQNMTIRLMQMTIWPTKWVNPTYSLTIQPTNDDHPTKVQKYKIPIVEESEEGNKFRNRWAIFHFFNPPPPHIPGKSRELPLRTNVLQFMICQRN